jgi:hypothetical protein
MEAIKEKLYKEFELRVLIGCEGVSFHPDIFKRLDLGDEYQEQVHNLFERDIDVHVGVNLPPFLLLPNGLAAGFKADKNSPLRLEYSQGRFYIVKNGNELTTVDFRKRAGYYKKKTSGGVDMRTVATDNAHGHIFVAYSNECALKDKGKDCLFCNINATKDFYGEAQGIGWKYPDQIGEVTAEAYKEGFKHITISGGFVPERREIEYYLDVAESIQEHTGLYDFNGTACIGAPHDLSVIEKYKDTGFRTLATNLEVWDKDLFRYICPGKEAYCGGHDHWLKSLRRAVKVFGAGNVRSNLVGGLETRKSTIDGMEYLAAEGIAVLLSPWTPYPGSSLEGHRSPGWEWHLELIFKNAEILRKNGFRYEQLYDASASSIFYPAHDIFRIEEELLPVFNKKNNFVPAV